MTGARALPFSILVVTDRAACARAGRSLTETLARMLAGLSPTEGARVAVLAREKEAPQSDVEAQVRALVPLVRRAGARLLVHTHAALVSALALDGLHVAGDVDAAGAARLRALLPPGALLGASRHGDDALDERALAALDYATLSPIWVPWSKPGDARPPLGLEALRGAAARSARPVVALGGVDVERAPACLGAGAAAVAVLGAVQQTRRPDLALHALLAALPSVGAATER